MAETAGRDALPLRYQVVFSTPPTHSPWRPGACRRAAGEALLLSLPEPLPSGTVLHVEVYWPAGRAVVELTGEVLAAEPAGVGAAAAAIAHRLAVLTITEEGWRLLREALSGPSGGGRPAGAPAG
ncbi:MAG TPA: hypothetical protein VGT06_09615 [Candidatus Methylomirabilis sp.]|jgi:hypothetical protein|nr:hypothetical protein [Candidatus Methylomirabilis sp.]